MKYEEKVMNGWEVKMFNPIHHDKPEEEREVIFEKKFLKIKDAHEKIVELLKPYQLKISCPVLRRIADGSYRGRLARIVYINKCKVRVNYRIVTTTDIKILD